MPVKKLNKDQKIRELEKELSEYRKTNKDLGDKSKKLITEVGNFQSEVGGAIIPFQRIGLYAFCILFFATGLGLIIYAATHPDMDDVPNTRDTMYIFGGVILAISLVIFFLGRYWLSTINNNRTLRQFNAAMFELDMLN